MTQTVEEYWAQLPKGDIDIGNVLMDWRAQVAKMREVLEADLTSLEEWLDSGNVSPVARLFYEGERAAYLHVHKGLCTGDWSSAFLSDYDWRRAARGGKRT
jgi:hypothetical protein